MYNYFIDEQNKQNAKNEKKGQTKLKKLDLSKKSITQFDQF